MKRPRNLAYPPAHPQTQTQSVNLLAAASKQSQSVRQMKSVLNGTFVHNPKRWDEYKKKLAELDPNFEVSEDPRLARQVKHSVCGGWFVRWQLPTKRSVSRNMSLLAHTQLVVAE
jgi:hypothetical protein